jgi:hypothetical protein
MRIEIDTGSRLDQPGDTTFAFSNDTKRAILLKQSVRDRCLAQLTGEDLAKQLRLFAACVYLLIRDHLAALDEVVIDQEYSGHEHEVLWLIRRFLKQAGRRPKPGTHWMIRSIGKKSPAHRVAWQTLRKQRKADKSVRASELLNLLRI